VLTQIILLLFEYINVKPRFYTREQVAQALAEYLCGLSSWRVNLPHSCTILGGWVMLGMLSVVNNFIYLKFIKNYLKASSFGYFNFTIKIL
jgi:hypothetical protein